MVSVSCWQMKPKNVVFGILVPLIFFPSLQKKLLEEMPVKLEMTLVAFSYK